MHAHAAYVSGLRLRLTLQLGKISSLCSVREEDDDDGGHKVFPVS